MSYFTSSFTEFFTRLETNNSTDWFNANRKTYEKEVKKPFAGLVEEMIGRIAAFEHDVAIKPADAISRINKDIRFSKDKTPYNTQVSANISRFGKKDKSYPGFYFQLSANKLAVFGGAYMLEPAALKTMRDYITGHLTEFSGAYNDKAFREKFGSIQGEQSKRIPPEYEAVVSKEPLIANKQFYYSAELDPGLITSASLPDTLMEYYHASVGVNVFLRKALNS